ncbi:XK-related protein 8.3 [Garra rufa]|uniref:XK-related protein 8.3 n=1 Tax=Garra rufa TaxID=137080 RepID=UPI003CCEED7C
MKCMAFPKYSLLDLFFTVFGVCTYLFDVGSDLWVAKVFYMQGEFVWFGVLVGFMLVSSVVVQLFSWLWLSYDRDLKDFESQASAGNVVLLSGAKRVKLLLVLHVCQLGFFIRHISAIWQGFRVWWRGGVGSDYAVYLTHDLSMLRLIETFCESAPQLTLMMYIMLHSNHARLVQYISVVASATSIAWMVVDYHRSLRSFLPDKDKQNWLSSVVYFFWNLFLIGPRVATVALFASVLPCYIAAHFLSLWLVFGIWACMQGTDFMDSPAGECLYRATVGLVWYFSWFNVTEGHTRNRSLIYHMFIIVDTGILLATWWLYRDAGVSQSYALSLIISIPLCYVLGLLIKGFYYWCFHPKLWRSADLIKVTYDVTDGVDLPVDVQADGASVQTFNKRMGRHAANFYTTNTSSAIKTNECKTTNPSVL